MAKQYYGCIRLTKHNPGWSDPINDIHLLRTHRTFKCVLEDYDLRPIMKGIKEGLIEFTRADIEGTSDADDGARLPMYCGHCICQAHLIKEGVLADYQADVDYQSDLEWQPPQPAERPAPTPNVQITGLLAQIEAGKDVTFQVKLDQLKPKKEMVDTGEVDENGEPIMEEQEVHQTVTVSVVANGGGTVEPSTLTFSSDSASPDYYMNAKEVKFTAPEESANVSIEISGDGVKAKTQSVKVQGDEPVAPPEEPEVPVVHPVIKINGSESEIEVPRGDSFVGTITVDYGDCNAGDLPLNTIEFILTSKVGGAGCTVNGADTVTFTGLGSAPDSNPCTVATIAVRVTCMGGTGEHTINQTFQVKVPELKQKIFYGLVHENDVIMIADNDPYFQNPTFFDDKITTDAVAQPYQDISGRPEAPTFKGAWVLLTPPGVNMKLIGIDGLGGNLNIYVTNDITVNGIVYKSQFIDMGQGFNGMKVEAKMA